MRKDPTTHLIYFGVQPQIADFDWIYEYVNITGWRDRIIQLYINDSSPIGEDYINDDEGNLIEKLYIYPETVNVTLKIGAQFGTNVPTGYFREIKIEEL
jgi:hypothetical protein